MKKTEAKDYLWENGPVLEQAEHFRFGTDAVLLGNFVDLGNARRGIDLGCASGVIAVLMLARSERIHMTGLEINAAAAEAARRNMERNGFAERSAILHGDIRRVRELLPAGSFDLAVSNPPYFASNAGKPCPSEARAAARGETECTLEELCAAAEYLCRWDGRFAVVYRPDRLSELFLTLTRHGLEPKRLRLVAHNVHSAPSLALVEARRGGKTGLTVEPMLFLRDENGADTEEIRTIYHRK